MYFLIFFRVEKQGGVMVSCHVCMLRTLSYISTLGMKEQREKMSFYQFFSGKNSKHAKERENMCLAVYNL